MGNKPTWSCAAKAFSLLLIAMSIHEGISSWEGAGMNGCLGDSSGCHFGRETGLGAFDMGFDSALCRQLPSRGNAEPLV
jgi:hypothetical protein